MCGRFANSYSLEKMARQYDAKQGAVQFDGSHNIAPTEFAPIIFEQKRERVAALGKFGIMMQAGGKTFPLINMQSEKAGNRSAFATRRCVIPADGFFEWEKVSAKDRQPYFFSPKDGVFSFAGLWSHQGDQMAFSILTTQANEVVGKVHGRMPVILGHNALSVWLAENTPNETLRDLMQPYPAGLMQVWKVSKAVNSVRNKDAACINSL